MSEIGINKDELLDIITESYSEGFIVGIDSIILMFKKLNESGECPSLSVSQVIELIEIAKSKAEGVEV